MKPININRQSSYEIYCYIIEKSHRTTCTGPRSDLRPHSWSWAIFFQFWWVVLGRLGLRCRAKVSFEWYPDGTAYYDWIPYEGYPSYYGFPRIGGSVTRATSRRYDAIGWASRVAWMQGEPSLSHVREESSFLRVSAHLFCGFMMPAAYDAGHHNFE
jgi:hypothetical protein